MNRVQTARRTLHGRRRVWPAALGAGVIASIGFSPVAMAEDNSDVRRELTQMRKQYDAELQRLRRDYDARLRRLEAKLKDAEQKPAAAPTTYPPAPLGPVATVAPPPPPGAVLPGPPAAAPSP